MHTGTECTAALRQTFCSLKWFRYEEIGSVIGKGKQPRHASCNEIICVVKEEDTLWGEGVKWNIKGTTGVQTDFVEIRKCPNALRIKTRGSNEDAPVPKLYTVYEEGFFLQTVISTFNLAPTLAVRNWVFSVLSSQGENTPHTADK